MHIKNEYIGLRLKYIKDIKTYIIGVPRILGWRAE